MSFKLQAILCGRTISPVDLPSVAQDAGHTLSSGSALNALPALPGPSSHLGYRMDCRDIPVLMFQRPLSYFTMAPTCRNGDVKQTAGHEPWKDQLRGSACRAHRIKHNRYRPGHNPRLQLPTGGLAGPIPQSGWD